MCIYIVLSGLLWLSQVSKYYIYIYMCIKFIYSILSGLHHCTMGVELLSQFGVFGLPQKSVELHLSPVYAMNCWTSLGNWVWSKIHTCMYVHTNMNDKYADALNFLWLVKSGNHTSLHLFLRFVMWKQTFEENGRSYMHVRVLRSCAF